MSFLHATFFLVNTIGTVGVPLIMFSPGIRLDLDEKI